MGDRSVNILNDCRGHCKCSTGNHQSLYSQTSRQLGDIKRYLECTCVWENCSFYHITVTQKWRQRQICNLPKICAWYKCVLFAWMLFKHFDCFRARGKEINGCKNRLQHGIFCNTRFHHINYAQKYLKILSIGIK